MVNKIFDIEHIRLIRTYLVIRRRSRKLGEPPRRRIDGLRDLDRDFEPRELRDIRLKREDDEDEDDLEDFDEDEADEELDGDE